MNEYVALKKITCIECNAKYEPTKIKNKDLHLVPNKFIVDSDRKVVGCTACLGEQLVSKNPVKMITWIRY